MTGRVSLSLTVVVRLPAGDICARGSKGAAALGYRFKVAETSQTGPWLRTVAHLRPAQVAHRARLRGLRVVDPWLAPLYRRVPAGLAGGWPEKFASIDSRCSWADADAVAAGTFTFLNQTRSLGEPEDWTQVGAAHLWRFNLHYMEWAYALADAGRQEDFARLWQSWSSAVGFAHRDAWSPYVVSLRAWVLCDTFGALVAGTDLEAELLAALWQHRTFLRAHVESDVGGNHLVKNLKALLGLAAFFADTESWRTVSRALSRELDVQILADGGHYELSPAYHCQVLGDLLDVAGLQAATGLAPMAGLEAAIERMRNWLGTMLGSSDELPMFNDCWQVGAERLAVLEPHRRTDRLIVLADSGYVVANPAPGVHLVMDVGDPCPSSLPAHAHADCLSFELYLDDRRVIVNSGTSTYEPGPQRDFERSTAAHNTVAIDGQNQTEVWGTFRAGRRAHGKLEQVEDDGSVITVVGSHDGYQHLDGAPLHRRTLRLEASELALVDTVTGSGPSFAVRATLQTRNAATRRLSVAVEAEESGNEPSDIAVAHGVLEAAQRVTVESGPRQPPVAVRSSLRW